MVHLVGFHYMNVSRCTVLSISSTPMGLVTKWRTPMIPIVHLYHIYPILLVRLHCPRLQLVQSVQFQWRLTIQSYFKRLRDILLLTANTSSHAVNVPRTIVSVASISTSSQHKTDIRTWTCHSDANTNMYCCY